MSAITLPKIPKEKDYEDYVAAVLQAAGLYIERNIIYREEAEILELDIFSSEFMERGVIKRLIEIKSGDWGFSDIFKIRGWMTYLDYNNGAFIVQKKREHLDYYKNKAHELGIDLLVHNPDDAINELCETFGISPAENKSVIQCIRFSYLLERKMLEYIKNLKRENPNIIGYKKLDLFFFSVNCRSFFVPDVVDRIKKLFKSFTEYTHIAAKLNYELEHGVYDDTVKEVSGQCYNDTFFYPKLTPIHVALYVEHIARISVLKACIEYIILSSNGQYDNNSIVAILNLTTLPNNIKEGVAQIASDAYFYRYPHFWQIFTYVMGGFILKDFEKEEHELLAKLSGIPVENIPNAFRAFDILFPHPDGWQKNYPRRNITWHNLFPVPFCGIGANLRLYLHCNKGENNYEKLEEKLTGQYTLDDLVKWNNLAHQFLSMN